MMAKTEHKQIMYTFIQITSNKSLLSSEDKTQNIQTMPITVYTTVNLHMLTSITTTITVYTG